MRLATLELLAFGPFSRVRLDLDADRPHFHLIYGPNEAGKSTALRAITGLLYGIPVNSSDDHLHRKKDLRIGARLGDGERVLDLVRRKGRLRTLTDPAENPLDEQTLTALLGGVDERLFTTLFGLDHERLRTGAHALLEGAGEIGESLFSAGGGGSHVGAVLGALRKEAEGLFTPRGRGGKVINHLLYEVAELRRKVAQEVTEPSGYLRQKAALDEAEAEREKLRQRSRELYAEHSKLSRVRAVLPWIAGRSELLRQLAALGDVPLLPSDAGERRMAAERQLDVAALESARLSAEIERGRARLLTLDVPEGLLRISDSAIELLQNRLGRHRAAEQDEPKLLDKLRAAEHEVLVLGRDMSPGFSLESFSQLRPSTALLAKVKRLCRERDQIEIEHKHARSAYEDLALKVVTLERELADAGTGLDVSLARGVLNRARGIDEIEKRRTALGREIQTLDEDLEAGVKNIGLWSGPPGDFAALRVPSEALIQQASKAKQAIEQEQRNVEQRALEIAEERARLLRDIELLCAEGAPPSAEELEQLRAERDRAWDGVKRASAAQRQELEQSWSEYEAWVQKVDVCADRMWREASRVTRLTSLHAECRALDASLARADAERLALLEKARRCEAEWEKAWHSLGIEALAPEHMMDWVRRRAALLEQIEARRAREAERAELCDREAALRGGCIAACQELGVEARASEPLRLVVDRLENAVEQRGSERVRHEQLRSTKATALAEREQAARQLEAIEARLATWQTEWQQSLQSLPLASDLRPTEALGALERLEQLLARVDGVRQIEQRVAGIARDRSQFSADVREIATEYYPEALAGSLLARPCGDIAEAMIQAFRGGSAAADERRRIGADISTSERALEEITLTRQEALRTLEALMQAARVGDRAELERVEAKVRRAEQLRVELQNAEHQLLALGVGASIADLTREAEGSDVDVIPARLSEIQNEIEEIGGRIETLTSHIAGVRLGIERLDIGAASVAEDLEASLERLRSTTRHYLRVRTAVNVLEREIEIYREHNQGPVVKRAGEIFARLTLGHYLGLQVDADDGDKQVLLCKRQDGAKVLVANLSDGTRDQLYLALRLASLERFAEQREPLPLVLDDILIHFDDERAGAALEVLGEYSTRGQVLFFTHHARLVELARARLQTSRLVVHELPSSHPPVTAAHDLAG